MRKALQKHTSLWDRNVCGMGAVAAMAALAYNMAYNMSTQPGFILPLLLVLRKLTTYRCECTEKRLGFNIDGLYNTVEPTLVGKELIRELVCGTSLGANTLLSHKSL